ncbi:MAG: hypothetical protein IT204_25020 [Fimbriimonadaceae bacterium]|nr:hypothetical protein [Fimbriimonadaceae bacterium]
MASGGTRRRNPLFIISSIGLFLFGLAALTTSLKARFTATVRPPEARQLWEQGYQSIYSTSVPKGPSQWVVVSKTRLNAGDSILREFVELRSAQWVVERFPSFKLPSAGTDSDQPLVSGFYERVEDVEEKYVAVDVEAETPLALPMVMGRNPFANPSDEARRDRITIAVPPGAGLYPLLQPGDRLNVFVVAEEEALLATMRSVRVVAVNNIVVKGSGILTAAEEAKVSAVQEAARRKKQQIEAQAQQQGEQAKADEAQPDDEPAKEDDPAKQDEATKDQPADEAAEEKGDTGGVDEQNLPKGTFKVGRKFDGKSLTLQVTREEAALLAMSQTLPAVRLDFALLPRR